MSAYACAYSIWAGLLLSAFSLAPTAALEPAPTTPAIIVCTTTHLSELVESLAKDVFQVETIVPWGMCPGHFELKQSDIENIRKAGLILGHGTEKFLAMFEKDKPDSSVADISIPGNWMIPDVRKKAVEQVALILADKFPANAETIHTNLLAYKNRIDSLKSELQSSLKKTTGMPVVCSTMCAEYAAWMGLDVAAEFQRDDDMSLRGMQDVIVRARKAGARIVIDNRQSSGKIGQSLARQLNLPLVMLSNFPEPNPAGQISYEDTLKKNVMALDPQTNRPKIED